MTLRLKILVIAVLLGGVGYVSWLHVTPKSRRVNAPEQAAPVPAPPVVSQNHSEGSTFPEEGKLQTISPNIRTITDARAAYSERLQLTSTLNSSVNHGSMEALFRFLRTTSNEDGKKTEHVLKNRVLDALCAQEPLPVGLVEVLTQMFRDQNQNVVIRDYALQHMVPLYDRLGKLAGTQQLKQPAVEMGMLAQTLWDALDEDNSSIAGTALLGLNRLVISYPELDKQRISEAALALARAERTGELTRISAFQVCSQMTLSDSLPLITSVAQNGATIPLRISAIGSLGAIGGSSELPLLRQILAGNAAGLKTATFAAIERINHRLGRNPSFGEKELIK